MLPIVLLLVAAALGAAWGAVLVHEAGHYLAGRLLGVPAGSIRIRLEQPPHVALRSGERWLSPDDPGYAEAFAEHRTEHRAGHRTEHRAGHRTEHRTGRRTEHRTGRRTEDQTVVGAAWWFVAAGFVVETAVVLLLTALLIGLFAGAGTTALVIVGASTAVLLTYLVADVVLSHLRGQAYGDLTSMWQLARAATAVVIGLVLLLRAAAIYLAV